jgi:P-type Cu2+ transporter
MTNSMTGTSDLSVFVRRGVGTAAIELFVNGVSSGSCINRIEQSIKQLPGVISARLNYTSKRLHVEWVEDGVDPAVIIDVLGRLGYRAHPFAQAESETAEAAQMQWLLRCLAIAGFAAMNIMLLSVSVWSGNSSTITGETRDFFHWLSALIALPAVSFAGQPFFLSAIGAIRAKRLNMDVPISLGVILALVMSVFETAHHATNAYFDSAVMLVFFLLAGRTLDHAMRRKIRAVAGNLAALRMPRANRIEPNGTLTQVPISALNENDTILVRPGERFPADGTVLSGASEIDESLVTGETQHRRVTEKDFVYAGTMSFSGALTVAVTGGSKGTMIDEIERLLSEAMSAKVRYVRLADRAAQFYAPVVHLTAVATIVGWLLFGATLHVSIITGIAVLIITCPCALALAVPAVQVVATGSLFRSGILLNAGDAIERLAEVDMVVLDKTGTLTLPELGVVNQADCDRDVMRKAARLALASHHPLAIALAKQVPDVCPLEAAEERPGLGITCMLEGCEARLGSARFCGLEAEAQTLAAGDPEASIIAFRHGDESAIYLVRQALRSDCSEAIAAFRQMNVEIAILSGDRSVAVEAIARELGIKTWFGGLKPAEKASFLGDWKKQGRRIVMIGDGINDAPALACANASLSPSTASELAQAASDAVFVGDRLQPVVDALQICRHARSLMRQNLILSVVYNVVALPLAVAGLVTPLIAAAAMSGSSILVTVNALRGRRVSGFRWGHEQAQCENVQRSMPGVASRRRPIEGGMMS